MQSMLTLGTLLLMPCLPLLNKISNVQDIRMHHVAVEKSEVSDSQNLLSNSSSKGNKVMHVSNGENAGGHFWWGADKRSHL